ncbi:S4 domain-containing protein YaaA [Cerasibacillus terrae]|uniref:S4 domain-containing protein YaaA n=1 Tax=Cerasibacillus terrae TaxID=2498845 RepID=A0A5C8NQ77_9BACI|nr:S4 domain-containing protein YaaA [Cerasibacillus terrae]TXL63398.1 S4 domain-containing protein YaaA [Cerasibacillus terrae]
MHEQIEIKTEYITLGQFLKLANILDSGGMIKQFLQEQGVLVNGEKEQRRGRKLYPNDVVEIDNGESFVVISE